MRLDRPAAIALTVLAYIFATFAVQAVSHFVIASAHYKSITIMRPEPVVALGFLATIVQGLIFAVLFPLFNRSGSTTRNALFLSWAVGMFLLSYIALAEPAKYQIASIATWSGVETASAAIQFTLFGLLLGFIHRQERRLAA